MRWCSLSFDVVSCVNVMFYECIYLRYLHYLCFSLQPRATSCYIKHHTKRSNNVAIFMLTDRSVRDAKPKLSVYRMRDSNVVCRGFGLTVAPSGSKTFFLSYTSPEDGKRKQVAVGRFPALSLRDARMKAENLREAVDAGRDPAVEKRHEITKRIETRQLGTLGDLLALYVLDLEIDGKRTANEVKRIKSKDVPPTLRDRPAHLISKKSQDNFEIARPNSSSILRLNLLLRLFRDSLAPPIL